MTRLGVEITPNGITEELGMNMWHGRLTARATAMTLAVVGVLVTMAVGLVGASRAAPGGPDPRTPSNERVRPSSAKAFELPGRELPALRTTHSRTYEQAHGGEITRVFADPVNYRAADGAYEPVSNVLVPSPLAGYRVRNRANA